MATDPEYAICPYCGEQHGDCWEWCPGEDAVTMTCQGCGKKFRAWSETTVMVNTDKITVGTPQELVESILESAPGYYRCPKCKSPLKTEWSGVSCTHPGCNYNNCF
jgi:RNA polymerase subunit RPABC4/transcription elongation factor Spt4